MRRDLDLDRAPSSASGQIETGVDGQSAQPGIEPLGVAETRQVAPGADEGFLDRVARELRVPEDEAGGRVQPREGRVDQSGEGVMIASPRAVDKLSLVHGRLDCATTWAVVFDRVWRRRQAKGSLTPAVTRPDSSNIDTIARCGGWEPIVQGPYRRVRAAMHGSRLSDSGGHPKRAA